MDITAWMTFYSVPLSELSTKTKGDMRFQGMAVRPHCQEGSQSNAESLRNNAEAARGITPASLSNITDVSVMVKRDLMPPDAAYTVQPQLTGCIRRPSGYIRAHRRYIRSNNRYIRLRQCLWVQKASINGNRTSGRVIGAQCNNEYSKKTHH